jgi:hypothetical protein
VALVGCQVTNPNHACIGLKLDHDEPVAVHGDGAG